MDLVLGRDMSIRHDLERTTYGGYWCRTRRCTLSKAVGYLCTAERRTAWEYRQNGGGQGKWESTADCGPCWEKVAAQPDVEMMYDHPGFTDDMLRKPRASGQ